MVALAEAEPRASSSPLPLAARTSGMSVTWSGGPVYGIKAFTGREWDPETGLYYYRARYYDPKAGRFISEDPIAFGGGSNFFGYVGNAPVSYGDPWGLIRYGLYATPQDRASFQDRAEAGAGQANARGIDSGLRMLAQLIRMADITQVDIHSHAFGSGLIGDNTKNNGFYMDGAWPQADVYEGAMYVGGLAYLVEQGKIDFEKNARINLFGCRTDWLAQELSAVLGQVGRGDIRVTGATGSVGPTASGEGAWVDAGHGRFNTYAGGKLVGHADYMPYR
jgi:RHS repeat-associated protein